MKRQHEPVALAADRGVPPEPVRDGGVAQLRPTFDRLVQPAIIP